MIDKERLLVQIVAQLKNDLHVSMKAADAAHAAAINEETQPDNKYDTLSLESSYVAQGHANRAQQLRRAVRAFVGLLPPVLGEEPQVTMASIVSIQYVKGGTRLLFVGPVAGGLKLECDGRQIVVITPESPLCKAILGKYIGDEVTLGRGNGDSFEILAIY